MWYITVKPCLHCCLCTVYCVYCVLLCSMLRRWISWAPNWISAVACWARLGLTTPPHFPTTLLCFLTYLPHSVHVQPHPSLPSDPLPYMPATQCAGMENQISGRSFQPQVLNLNMLPISSPSPRLLPVYLDFPLSHLELHHITWLTYDFFSGMTLKDLPCKSI